MAFNGPGWRSRAPRSGKDAMSRTNQVVPTPRLFCLVLAFGLGLLPVEAEAQPGPGAPPAVGVVRVERQQITQTDEFIGRIQAVGRVALVARVTGYLEKRMFVEGDEVKKGDLLYEIEQPPFQAQVDSSKAAVDQLEAQHRNAKISLDRAQELLSRNAGPQS